MDFSHYSDHPVQTAVELVNTFDVVSGEEGLSDLNQLSEFVNAHIGEWLEEDWVPQSSDLHEIRALRSRLRDVFEAEEVAIAAERLNGILRDSNAVPRVSVHGPGPHLHFESDGVGPGRLLGAITAMALSVALVEGGFERFGTCDSTTCDDVYVDTSRNRSRRNCSDTCTTREAVAAHRARQKE